MALQRASSGTDLEVYGDGASQRRRGRRTRRARWALLLSVLVALSLLLVACGGDDDDGDDGDDADSTPQTAASSMAITPSTAAGGSGSGGAQTPAAMPGSGGGSTPAAMPGSGTQPTTDTQAEATQPAAAETPAEQAAEPTATTSSTSGGGGNGGGGTVPTQASSDFPDIHVPLEVGSSGEVGATGASDLSDSPEKHPLRATLVSIIDPATIDSVVYTNDPGLRYIGFEMKLEALGDAPVNSGIWTLGTTDGQVYENLLLTGVGEDILYGDVEPGTPLQGILVFQIPEDATVEWLFLSPHIYVGENLIFVAP